MSTDDPILVRIRVALRDAYGQRLERAVLYGSRARGDARPDSDYDIAVFVDDIGSNWQEFQSLARIELEILARTGASVHAMPYRAGTWRDPASPLMHEIRRDGFDL